MHNPNTNNNQIITSKYPPKDNAESLFVLNYSNQMETLPLFAEDSSVDKVINNNIDKILTNNMDKTKKTMWNDNNVKEIKLLLKRQSH